MKTMVIAVHPELNVGSRANGALAGAVKSRPDISFHDLYAAYPNRKIDVAREQELIKEHERIILQFPFWWYSAPSMLKQWLDEVLTFGWAYGPGGDNLRGKELGLAITTGSAQAAYGKEGYNRYTMEEMTRPYQAICNMVGMNFLPIFSLHDAMQIGDEQLEREAARYGDYVTAVRVQN